MMQLREILEGLRSHEVRYVLIGGVAGQLHGSSALTEDVDILYDTSEENRTRLANFLQSISARLRDVPADLPVLVDARTLRDLEILTLRTTLGDLDVMQRVPGVGDFAAALGRSDQFDLQGTRVQVLGLDALIDAKEATGRPKDREHLLILRAIAALRAELPPPER